MSKNEIYFLISVFIFIASFLVFIFYGPNYNKRSETIDFLVPEGANFSVIVDELYNEGIIPNKFNLKIAAFLLGVDKNIKAGHYDIPDGISYVELLDLLNEGAPKKQKLVTIQEGIWQRDLAALISKELGIEKDEILKLSKDREFINSLGLDVKNLEGYLLPNTYYFYEGSNAKQILSKLASEMNKIFEDPDVQRRMNELGMDKNEILTMASIIDGESNIISEFERISGVYHNRLRKRWRLQADPTVQYIVRERRRKVNKIYYKDLEIDSKYNTYLYYGLPPSPINNPGREAIMAALYPEQHDYYYFVADGTGGHAFSRTSREHQNNVNRYRNWRRENNK